MKSLQVFIFACVALLHFHQIAGLPVLQAGHLAEPTECRIETMDEVEHKTFYDYCSSFEGSEINIPRHNVYFEKNEKYTDSEMAVLQILNPGKASISPECLVLLQPFVCFYFFKFPLTDDCADGYLPPCNDLCELTHQNCMKDLEMMVEQGVINDTKNLEHLECTNFEENNKCITFTPSTMTEAPTATDAPATTSASTETSEADSPVTDAPATDAPVTDTPVPDVPVPDAPVDCNCAKKVRQNVTKRMIMDPAYTLAAHISVLALREEGEGAEKHVVYDVTVVREYQISCREPVEDGEVTTIHMETPKQCLEGDHGCRGMEVGRDHQYLVVGTTTSDGKWLLKDSKGSGGCAISNWIPKYEQKMHKWASKSVPTECPAKNGLPVSE